MNSIGEEYKRWWETIGPREAGRVQIEEMRRGFYSGAFVMFTMLTKCGDLSRDEAMAMMASWEAELLAFIATVQHMRTPKP